MLLKEVTERPLPVAAAFEKAHGRKIKLWQHQDLQNWLRMQGRSCLAIIRTSVPASEFDQATTACARSNQSSKPHHVGHACGWPCKTIAESCGRGRNKKRLICKMPGRPILLFQAGLPECRSNALTKICLCAFASFPALPAGLPILQLVPVCKMPRMHPSRYHTGHNYRRITTSSDW